MVPMSDAFIFPATAAADAMAEKDYFAIGVFLEIPGKGYLWFSETWSVQDLSFTGLELSDKAQLYIASFEALAQIALLHVLTAALPGGRMRVRIKSWSDNTGADCASNRLYTNKYPLNMFVQRLSLFSCYSGVSLDVSHIPGELNEGQASHPSCPTASLSVGAFPCLEQLWF